uniref:DUF862 domain-containing protein n=1 Tax=Strongyloides papillosus TaxID=174720 RepID=A0A0N5BXH5_STREA
MPEEVILNIYKLDLQGIWKRAGIYHTGVEVYGREFMFGGHSENKTGITSVRPKQACEYNNIFIFKKCINMGITKYDKRTIYRVIEQLGKQFSGVNYHLLKKNCNNFSDEFCKRIIGKGIPKKYNRIARVINSIPLFYKIFSEQRFTFRNFDVPIENNNRLIIEKNDKITCSSMLKGQSKYDQDVVKKLFRKKSHKLNVSLKFKKITFHKKRRKLMIKFRNSISRNQILKNQKYNGIINYFKKTINCIENNLY